MNATQHQWSLSDLTAGMAVTGTMPELQITCLSADSRMVKPGGAFVACKGIVSHGLDYVESAKHHGAVVVLYDEPNAESDFSNLGIPLVKIEGLKSKLGKIANRFFGAPSHKLNIVGVTGTNGKTSVCHYLVHALNQIAGPCGYIGTTGYAVGEHCYPAQSEQNRTTPDVISVHALLDEFVQQGASHTAMEVSSHALNQGRVDGVSFGVVVFTNLTRDHLDYHSSMEDYAAAKRQLLYHPGVSCAVVNIDDAEGREWLKHTPDGIRVITCSAGGTAYPGEHLRAGKVSQGIDGLNIEVSLSSTGTPVSVVLKTGLLGEFNVENLILTIGALQGLGVPFEEACQLLETVQPAPGRMQQIVAENKCGENKPLVVVDYAHTPDALEKALISLRSHFSGKLVCVFGCGGDRDTGKRPLMGEVVARLADKVYITDDNPRNESPAAITNQILAGIDDRDAVVVIHDRLEAIRLAINNSTSSDCVLVAGKGHESFQLTGDVRHDFSDSAAVESVLQEVVE